MKRIICRVLIPNKFLLFIYSLISFIFLLLMNYLISFFWELIYSFSDYLIFQFVLLITLFFISFLIDEKYNWKTNKYFIISIIQLLIITSFSHPIKNWQIKSSIEKSNLIINALEQYKTKFSIYPSSFNELESGLEIKLPKRTNIGTQYWYHLETKGNYQLRFLSYSGYTACYNIKNKEWLLVD